MLEWILGLLVKLLLFVVICLSPFVIMSVFYFFYFKFYKKMKPPEKEFTSTYKKRNFFLRLFIDFPRQFVLDRFTVNPNEFGYYGYHLFVGEQGSGKTVATVEFLRRIRKEYPLCNIATNFEYVDEDSSINSWKDLVFNNNGIYGQVDVIDEVQNWFCSNQSKDFPPEMIQEITQQRKQRKILIGTTQRFERMAKPLREQVNYLYYPMTFAGCFTIVKVCKPSINPDGLIEKSRMVRMYFFIHDSEIRNSFDTFHKIKKQAEAGFIENRQADTTATFINQISIDKKALRKK